MGSYSSHFTVLETEVQEENDLEKFINKVTGIGRT
jgi:hypothetical protein